MRVMEVAKYVDPFITLDDVTLNLKKSNGLIALWEAILHDRIYLFIDQELETNPNFLDQELEPIKLRLEEISKAKATELTPQRGTAATLLNEL